MPTTDEVPAGAGAALPPPEGRAGPGRGEVPLPASVCGDAGSLPSPSPGH